RGFPLPGCLPDRIRRRHVELEPRLWCGDLPRPGGRSEGRLGRLRERPQRERPHTFKVVVGPIPRRGLFQLDAHAAAPECPTRLDVTHDGPEAGHEAHLHLVSFPVAPALWGRTDAARLGYRTRPINARSARVNVTVPSAATVIRASPISWIAQPWPASSRMPRRM